jgi:hypothetical protein
MLCANAERRQLAQEDMTTLPGWIRWMAASGVAAALSLAFVHQAAPAQTQQELMKICADEWNSLKAANRTGDKVYQDFIRECLARHRAAPKPEGRSAPAAVSAD